MLNWNYFKMKIDLLITMASWEERFLLGFKRNADKYSFKRCIMYYYEDYAERTKENRSKMKKTCDEQNINIDSHNLKNPKDSWIKIFTTLNQVDFEGVSVLIDITTMPREIIWIIFDLLDTIKVKFDYVYYRPEKYSDKWLSRDPGRPRIVYKLSGIAKIGLPTKMLIITGFDLDRVKQLINFFEPKLTLLGIQTGSQFYNERLNAEKHKEEFSKKEDIKMFDVDSYSEDHGYKQIKSMIQNHTEDSNMLMSSLGPKISAVSLYKVHKSFPNTGLTYAPSREYNIDYSKGLKDEIFSTLEEL